MDLLGRDDGGMRMAGRRRAARRLSAGRGTAAAGWTGAVLTLESVKVRFSISPKTGAYELTDKRTGVTWSSHPRQPRLRTATLEDGNANRVVPLNQFWFNRRLRRLRLLDDALWVSDADRGSVLVPVRLAAPRGVPAPLAGCQRRCNSCRSGDFGAVVNREGAPVLPCARPQEPRRRRGGTAGGPHGPARSNVWPTLTSAPASTAQRAPPSSIDAAL